jgi:FkbM family methyltransferase
MSDAPEWAKPTSFGKVYRQTKHVLSKIWNHPSNRGKRLRRVLYAVAFQIWGRVTKRPMKVAVGSRSQMFAYLHMSASSEVVYANPPSTELTVWQRNLGADDWFIDVGAAVGVFSIFALEKGAKVIAFEPNPRAADVYEQNMTLNGYTPELRREAVSNQEGIAEMTFDLGVANHLLYSYSPEEWTKDVRKVRTTTLDDVIGDKTGVCVKLDTEGVERLVLEGAGRALAEKRIRLMQVEWNIQSMRVLGETREPLAKILIDAGYVLVRPDQNGDLTRPVKSFKFGADVFAIPG